eukprot:TRINITY_DN3900_c0_g1_i1.p1 TRINITY_DN3900_c0_g1~~TRINITY_DN3900_c0_g1_i1.p1  ORF type:complete len:477 (-),score=34.01 TRINITY_DN3900_c0_g1_i1:1078-2475(-)
MVGMNILQYSLSLSAVIFVGHLGKLELAACSLASSMASISCHTLLLALASALETFCGQAYGAGQYKMVGNYTQRAMFILCLITIPIAAFLWYLEPVLLLLGQEPIIALHAGNYAQLLLPTAFASALTQPLIKFYQAQSETVLLAVCQFAAVAVQIPLIYVFVWPLGFGYRGAAIATSIAWWVNLLLLAGYLKWSPSPKLAETWTTLPLAEIADWPDIWRFLKLAIPSALMIILEYWCFEVNVVLCGLLPNPELMVASFSIGFSTMAVSYMIPYGMSAAASTRISNELGAGNALGARFACRVSYSLIVFISCTVFTLLMTFKRQWASIFIEDVEVVDLVAAQMPFIASICLADGLNAISSGSIRGIGHQHLGAIVNLGAYYGIALPGAFLLAFKFHQGSNGLYMALMSGQFTQVAILVVLILFFTNWHKEAARASERILAEGEATDSSTTLLPSDNNDYKVLQSTI